MPAFKKPGKNRTFFNFAPWQRKRNFYSYLLHYADKQQIN